MARFVANVDIITDSFEIWLLETNELLHALSTEIITANTTYANTGNSTISRTAQLWGKFGANNIVVSNTLSGGNVNGLSANLLITTNATAYVAADAGIRVLAGNSTSNSYLNPVGVFLGLGTANSFVNTTLIVTQSNSTVNTNITSLRVQVANSTSTANMTATAFSTGIFVGNTTAMAVGANLIANATSLYIGNSTQNSVLTQTTLSIGNSTVNTAIVSNSTAAFIDTDGYLRVLGNAVFSNTMLVVGNTTLSNTLAVTGNTTLANTLAVTGNTALANTLTVTGNATLSNTLSVTGNTTLANTLAVTGAATLSNTIAVTGAATLSNTLAVTGNATFSNIATFQTDYVVDVSANADIGSTIGAVLIYRFPKATYSSAKFEVQVKNGNTQISELVLAHDGASNAYVTTYGTVASNGAASPLGTFSANTNTANVNLYLVQTVANSAVKVVAHLIK